jgi:hypothetical protein
MSNCSRMHTAAGIRERISDISMERNWIAMKISFSTRNIGKYPFPVTEYYHVYFLGLWTPFCKKWHGINDELEPTGFPGPEAKMFIRYLIKPWQKLKYAYRRARRLLAVKRVSRQAAYDYFLSLGDHSTYDIDHVAKRLDDLGFRASISADRKEIEVNGSFLCLVQPDFGDPGIDGLKIGMVLYELLFGEPFRTEYLGAGWIYRDILQKLNGLILHENKNSKLALKKDS